MIVRYKTAYYTFYLPCAIGMIYAGVRDQASYRLARDICCRIGEFFQIQDDFLDCFGENIGKVCVCVFCVCLLRRLFVFPSYIRAAYSRPWVVRK